MTNQDNVMFRCNFRFTVICMWIPAAHCKSLHMVHCAAGKNGLPAVRLYYTLRCSCFVTMTWQYLCAQTLVLPHTRFLKKKFRCMWHTVFSWLNTSNYVRKNHTNLMWHMFVLQGTVSKTSQVTRSSSKPKKYIRTPSSERGTVVDNLSVALLAALSALSFPSIPTWTRTRHISTYWTRILQHEFHSVTWIIELMLHKYNKVIYMVLPHFST